MTLTGTYSPEDNKLRLYASSRLDVDTYAQVRAVGFIWAPKQELFVAPMWTPQRADLLEELCGEIGDEDTSLAERAEERADRFTDYRESRAADADAAHQAVSAIADGIPMGQPILVGHHSERHARKDAERIENGMRRAVKMWETSQYWKSRAAGAIRHAKYKELPAVRARRIKTIEADQRKQQRIVDDSTKKIALWTKPGVELTRERAVAIANFDGGTYVREHTRASGYVGPLSLWEAVRGISSGWGEDATIDEPIATPEQAREQAVRNHEATIRWAQRWIDHYAHRLEYERAMLDEQGASDLLKPKPKSAKAQLPLCNYREPAGLSIENIYHRGEMIHYPQIEMTSAEWAKVYADYKGTRVVDHSHRVRTTMQRHSLFCVFLTDSKAHKRPAPLPPPSRTPPPLPRPTAEPVESRELEGAEAIDAMRAALKAGVQVVSAPQLFPTPVDVACQVAKLAEIRPGDRILEPSAGTGALLMGLAGALFRGKPVPLDEMVMVEINVDLAKRLMVQWPRSVVWARDFLEMTAADLGGTFDRIVMNPPFERGSDIKHIEHAASMLKPGGRLVAICAAGPRQRDAFDDAEWIDLPDGTFKEQGTNVRTAIVVIDRPAAREYDEFIAAEEWKL